MKVLGFTGHRLSKLEGDTVHNHTRLFDLAKAVLERAQPDLIFVGMEPTGWDMAVAKAAAENPDIAIHAAIPYEGHENKYRDFLAKCRHQTFVSTGGYSVKKLHKRNEFIVDNIKGKGPLIALWDGTKSGTSNAVSYAQSQGVEVINVWNSWIKYKDLK